MCKRGISLITLIITIIVIIILAGAVIVSLNNTDIIKNANISVNLVDKNNIISSYNLIMNDNLIAKETGIGSIKNITLEILANSIGRKEEDLIDKFKINEIDGNLEEKQLDGSFEVIAYNLMLNNNVNVNNTFDTNGNKDLNVASVMKPNLYGMIPIKVSGNNFIETTENDSEWYKYIAQSGDDGKSHWANAMTKDGSQFVFIPRFAYRIPEKSEKIDVKFIDYYNKTEDGKDVEKLGYIVHPAFDLPNNERLKGIWVGKYETGYNNGKLLIKPSVTSFLNSDLSDKFDKCYYMGNDTQTYGFKGIKEGQTHMMKNIEWGAVSYLAHSQYGRNGMEVTINNNENNKTGIAGNSVSDNKSSLENNLWNTEKGVYASTTKNITGIYDMNGGNYEYVAANYNFNKSGNNGNSGNANKFNELFDKKDKKYFDFYDEKGYKVGDATLETMGWNGDSYNFITDENPWFLRGGKNDLASRSGIFEYNCSNASMANAFRVCIFSYFY